MKKKIKELLNCPRMGPSTSIAKDNNNIKGLIDLIDHIGGLNDKVICEIGCFIGISTETFLQYSPKKLYAIDAWGLLNESYEDCNWILDGKLNFNSVEETFRTMAKNYDNIEIIKNYSHLASLQFKDQSLDFIYIDGEHKYESVKQDILNWMPKIKSSGYISGHDINQIGVVKAVSEIFDRQSIVAFDDTSWLVKVS